MKKLVSAAILATVFACVIPAYTQDIEIIDCRRTNDDKYEMTWNSETGKRYNVLYSDDLENWEWLENVESQGTTTTWQKPLSEIPDARMFKIKGFLTKFDIDMCFIKRLPEIDYVWYSPDPTVEGWPTVGQTVTWRAHVKNWAAYDVHDIPYAWYVDDELVESGYTDLPSRVYATVDFDWTWTFDRHKIKFVIDHTDSVLERFEGNNQLRIYSDAITVVFYVEQSLYDYFHANQRHLGDGSNSWDNWAKRHINRWNSMFEDAVWGSDAPDGVLDRIRCDQIHIVEDGALPLHGGLPSNNPNLWDDTVDLQWGFPSSILSGGMYSDVTTASDSNPFYFEGSLMHELGHARYLIDSYGFDTHNTAHHGGHDAVQIWEGDTYVGGSAYMPYIAWEEVLYYNKSGGVMSGPYGYNWSPYETMALNFIAGHRAACGNYNSPCNIGVYLQDLPLNNHVRFVNASAQSLVGANVRVYETESGPGWYGKTIDNTYDQEYTTDGNGYIHMPRNPFNPGGDLTHTYGMANGVMVLRIEHTGQIWYRFMEASDFNIEYWRGNTQNAFYIIQLD